MLITEFREMVIMRILPAVRKRPGMLRIKFLAFDICFYWPTGPRGWGWGFHLMIWGLGFDIDGKQPANIYWIRDPWWYWLPEVPTLKSKEKPGWR